VAKAFSCIRAVGEAQAVGAVQVSGNMRAKQIEGRRMGKNLADTSDSVDRFILEAEQCASQELGFAAMLTVFPVILAVSEAVNPNTSGNERLLEQFVRQMPDKTSWLITPVARPPDNIIAKKLVDVRDSLAHQLSLPLDVHLVNTNTDARQLSRGNPDKYVISTAGFVDAAKQTIRKIITSNPNANFDPHPRTSRSSALRFLTSASGASVSEPDLSGNP